MVSYMHSLHSAAKIEIKSETPSRLKRRGGFNRQSTEFVAKLPCRKILIVVSVISSLVC